MSLHLSGLHACSTSGTLTIDPHCTQAYEIPGDERFPRKLPLGSSSKDLDDESDSEPASCNAILFANLAVDSTEIISIL